MSFIVPTTIKPKRRSQVIQLDICKGLEKPECLRLGKCNWLVTSDSNWLLKADSKPFSES